MVDHYIIRARVRSNGVILQVCKQFTLKGAKQARTNVQRNFSGTGVVVEIFRTSTTQVS